jgi:hypothetical protein
MAIFDNLQSEVTPTRSVEQPSALGSIASILQSSGFFNEPKEAPKPTEGERYEAAWGKFLEEEKRVLQPGDPGYGNWLKGASTRFVASNPSFATEQKALLESQGLAVAIDPAEAVADKRQTQYIDFFGSNLGMVAEANAEKAATDKNGVLNEALFEAEKNKAFSAFVAQQAEVARIAEESKTITDQKVVATRYWDTGKGMARSVMVQQVDVLANLVEDVKDGSAEITPEMSQVLGLPAGKVTPSNFSTLLLKYRPTLVNALVSNVESELIASGADPNVLAANPAPEAWIAEAMAPIDAVIKAGADFDTAGKVLKNQQDQDMFESYMNLEPNMKAAVSMAGVIPPELRSQVYGLFTDIGPSNWKRVADKFTLKLTADRPSVDVITDISNMSVGDARVEATAAAGVLDSGSVDTLAVKNSVITLFAGSNRADPAASLGLETFKAIGKNAEKINQEAGADPEFKAFVVDNFVSDLNKNYKEFGAALRGIPNTIITTDEQGRITVIPDPAKFSRTNETTGQTYQDPAAVEATQMMIDMEMKSELGQAFMLKLAELDRMGAVGAEAKEAFLTANGLNMPKGGTEGGSVTAQLLDKFEGGGDYNALFGFANREGGPFAGTNVSQMTIGELKAFADGEYADYSRKQLGYKATPMGRYQFVGSTLSAVAQRMGLPDDTVFSPEVQDQMFVFHAQEVMDGKSPAGKRAALRGTWEGLQNASDAELDQMIAEIEGGTASFGTTGVSGGGFRGARPTDANAVAAQAGGAMQRAVENAPASPVPAPTTTEIAPASTEAAVATLPEQIPADNNAQGADQNQQAQQQGQVDPEVQALIDNLSPKTKRQLRLAGIEPNEVKFYQTEEEAVAAIEAGELVEGMAFVLPDGSVRLVEASITPEEAMGLSTAALAGSAGAGSLQLNNYLRSNLRGGGGGGIYDMTNPLENANRAAPDNKLD